MKYRQQCTRLSGMERRFTRDSAFRKSSHLLSMKLMTGCQLGEERRSEEEEHGGGGRGAGGRGAGGRGSPVAVVHRVSKPRSVHDGERQLDPPLLHQHLGLLHLQHTQLTTGTTPSAPPRHHPHAQGEPHITGLSCASSLCASILPPPPPPLKGQIQALRPF
ncbi:hypothetical protein EYF80_061114 [Liparis tanakae]|uniref:Uncharacterized protein n=1 Tax=Liparis tanakae TaxID=230148 RepID=A0A4Z2EIG3_9TELE|nr:hypothetical protein EYF80_061114 [Liparis tanakae]